METLDRLFAHFRLFPLTPVCKVKQGMSFFVEVRQNGNTVAAFSKYPSQGAVSTKTMRF